MCREITDDDVERAIDLLEPLGCAYKIIKLAPEHGNNVVKLVQSVPRELSNDQTVLLSLALNGQIVHPKGWSVERFEHSIQLMIEEGILWVDAQPFSEGDSRKTKYWALGLFA